MRETIDTLTAPVDDFRLSNWLAAVVSSDYQEALQPWEVDVSALRHARLLSGLGGEVRVLEQDGELKSLMRTRRKEWDEAVLGLPVLKIEALAGGGVEERHGLLSRAVASLRPGSALLTARVRGDDYPSMHALEASGFRVADSMNIFLKDLTRASKAAPSFSGKAECIVPYDRMNQQMRDVLAGLGTDSFRHSRIYNDPRMPRDKADKFYRTLTERFLDDEHSTVFVAMDDGQPVGFVIGSVDDELENVGGVKLGYLWLITVDRDHAGRGFGMALFRAFESAMHSRVRLLEVGTQTHNYAALNIYAKAGMILVSSLVTFHAWIE